MNILVDNFNLDNLTVLGHDNFIGSVVKHEAGRLLDFSYNPVAIRYFIKRKATVFFRGSSHQCVFFCKVGFINLKQTDYSTSQCFAVFGNFLTGNRTVNEFVLNRVSIVDCNLNICGVLTGIAESKRILGVGENIMLIGCKFPYIVASKRKVGFQRCLSVFGQRDNLNQTVCRNGSTTCGYNLLCDEKTEADILHFIAVADVEDVVLFDSLFKTDCYFLPVVYKACGSFGYSHFLTGISQLNLVGFFVDNHTLRCGDFNHRIFSEIKLLALCKTAFACRYGIYNLALCVTECSVGSNNIFCCGNFIYRTCKTFHFIDRLIDNIGIFLAGDINPEECLAGLFNADCTLLCHIWLIHLNHSNSTLIGGLFLCNIKVHRCAVKHISVRSLNLYKRISFAVFQLFRCYKLSVCVRVECVNGGRGRISEGHCNLIALRVIELEACSGIRNVFSAFSVHLNHLDITLKICVVDKIAVGLSVLRNEHIKIVH